MENLTVKEVSNMSKEEQDQLLVDINSERIRETSLLGTRIEEISAVVEDKLVEFGRTLNDQATTLNHILLAVHSVQTQLRSLGGTSGVGGKVVGAGTAGIYSAVGSATAGNPGTGIVGPSTAATTSSSSSGSTNISSTSSTLPSSAAMTTSSTLPVTSKLPT